MLRTTALALTIGLMAASPAFASQCPQDMAAIDRAMQTAQLSATEKQQVMDLRQRGEAAHKAGNHAESERLLGEAKAMLKI